jgi:YVTN family beta-propeller protein
MEFRVLGPMEASHRGRLLPLGGRRQRALLAILLLHAGELVPTDRLIDELWGERAPEGASKLLRVYVSRLRKALDGAGLEGPSRDLLVTAAGGYVLHVEPGALDSRRFLALAEDGRQALAEGDPDQAADKLSEALALWRGPAFVDLQYVSFAQSEVARLEEARLVALEDRIESDLARGRHRGLVGELRTLVGEHPLRERLAAQLMLALYRSGRQAEALGVYQLIRRTLVDELGLEPGEELRTLQEAILRQDATLQAPARAVQSSADTEATAGPKAATRRRATIGAGGVLGVAGVLSGALLLAHGHSVGPSRQPNSVAAIDPATNRVVADVPVGSRPAALSFGDGALWVANLDDNSVSRINPGTREVVRTIATAQQPAGVAAGAGGVWVASPNGSLQLIDPTFNVVSTLATGSRGYLTAVDLPSPAVAGANAVWVVNKTSLSRYDPQTHHVEATIGVGLSPAGLVIGDGAVWVADSAQDTVTRVDPVTNTSTTTPVGHGASAIAAGGDGIWVADTSDDALVRIDPQTNAVTDTIPVGHEPTGVALGGGSLWVANSGSGTVSRIDPSSRRVIDTIAVGGSPNSVVYGGGTLWVSLQANAIGSPGAGERNVARLDLQATTDMLSLDPALADASDPWQLEYATCAKLLNYPDASGPAALQQVPEIASAPPRISPDGRTYTFEIRSGFRFSPPSDAAVTAATFRATIERTLDPGMHSPADAFMGDIVGASAYMSGKAAHLAGVSARGATLTIRLLAPDPILPVKLATPYFCAVPVGTPVNPAGVPGIPSAGPYYVSSYVPGREIIVRRNPNYGGTRPRRIAEFVYTIGIDPTRSVRRIESGRADYLVSTLVGALPYSDNARLLARYGPHSSEARAGRQQYFINPTPGPLVIWLNTSRPLFAHVNLRRALNYAIDRAALVHEVEQSGGPLFLPADEYLTPGIPGYKPVATYPLDHPDLATARRLAGPGPHGTATFLSGVFDTQNDQIVARALRAIGIEVVIKRHPLNTLLTQEHTARAPFDLVSGGYGLDYPDPYDVLNASFDGHSITAHQNPNVSNFNDPVYNRELEAAARLSGAARYQAYARLDTDLVTNAAPMVAWATSTSQDFFSARVGCQIYQPVYGMDLAALCLR